MRLFVSRLVCFGLAIAGVIASPVFAQSAAPLAAAPSTAQIEKGINEAARSLESLSRILAIMGPGLSKAMQAAGPGIGRAVQRAQPSLNAAMATARPQIDATATRMATAAPHGANAAPPTGADMARSMQTAAASLESLSRMMGSVAPDLGKAYDAAAPELRTALAAARPALEEAIKAAGPELKRLAPAGGATPSTSRPVSESEI